MTTHYLACDLGAESGRLMLGSLDGGKLSLEELHRFPNTPIKTDGSLCWDIPGLFRELKVGLRKAGALKLPIVSISTDSWGVDYLLLDAQGEIIPPAFHYRDPRTARGVTRVKASVDWPNIFDETGIQFMPLNTIYQLAAESSERVARAARILMIADAFNFFLCGKAAIEESNASTTQLYNPRTRQWSKSLLGALDLPERLLPTIVPSGTSLGPLRRKLADETGLSPIQVIASCSHDTGAAVAAVPADGANWAYLSSGTWSLLGVELPAPLITDACRELNFTNEIGYGGSVRLLKNISGLWLVQECRRAWATDGQHLDYETLMKMAAAAPPFVSLIDPMDARFVAAENMPEAIAAFCRETGQPAPVMPGAFIRCALESLALLYRRTLQQIERLVGRKLERLHVVGGGSRNSLLNQFTADALQIPVLAGPAEATAAGNVLVQAIALGHVHSLSAARKIVRDSMPHKCVNPSAVASWNSAWERWTKLGQ
jgi:rhamnulokinase